MGVILLNRRLFRSIIITSFVCGKKKFHMESTWSLLAFYVTYIRRPLRKPVEVSTHTITTLGPARLSARTRRAVPATTTVNAIWIAHRWLKHFHPRVHSCWVFNGWNSSSELSSHSLDCCYGSYGSKRRLSKGDSWLPWPRWDSFCSIHRVCIYCRRSCRCACKHQICYDAWAGEGWLFYSACDGNVYPTTPN